MKDEGGKVSAVECDAYGFPLEGLSAQDIADRERCRQKQVKRAARWAAYADSSKAIAPHDRRLKERARKGVPPSLRPEVWFHVSGAARRHELAGADYFGLLLSAHEGEVTRSTQVIELDLPRTFPSNAFVSSHAGKDALRRVLVAFSFHNRRIGYCQALNYIAGLLLLVLRDEEKAFWVLAVLLEDILYRDIHANDLIGCHVEQRVLKQLLEKKLPKVARHLEELQCDLSILATEWVLTVFIKSLPAETATRIMDAVLLEGSKVMFRVALAIFKLNEHTILEKDNMGDVMHLLQRYTACMHNRDHLMKVAFKKIGRLGMGFIISSRKKNQVVVNGELEARSIRLAKQ